MTYSQRRGLVVIVVGAFLAGAITVGKLVSAQTGGLNPGGTAAQPPRLLAYAGFLESNGATVDSVVPMRFIITDSASAAATACGGATGCLWVSGAAATNVTVNDGHFSVVLGDGSTPGQNSFPAALFTRSALYLRVLVGSPEQLLSGAQRLVATPYAITAETATTFNVSTLTATSLVRTPSLVVGGGAAAAANASTVNGSAYVSGVQTVQGNLAVGGTIGASGNINLAAAAHVSFPAGRIYEPAAFGANLTNIFVTNTAHTLCFLSGTRHYDNVSGGDTEFCQLTRAGAWPAATWTISTGADSTCNVTCLTF